MQSHLIREGTVLVWLDSVGTWLREPSSIFQGLTALAAVGGLWAALWANMMTRKMLADERASHRPWLAPTTVTPVNVHGNGFALVFRLQNYGTRPAVRPRVTTWVLSHSLGDRALDDVTACTQIVPTQQWAWETHIPAGATGEHIGIRVQYTGLDGTMFEEWMFYEWPQSAGGLAKRIMGVDAGECEALRHRIDRAGGP